MAADILAERQDLRLLLIIDDSAVNAIRLFMRGRQFPQQLVGAGQDIMGPETHLTRAFNELFRPTAKQLSGPVIPGIPDCLNGPGLCLGRRPDLSCPGLLIELQPEDIRRCTDLPHLRQHPGHQVPMITRRTKRGHEMLPVEINVQITFD